MTSPASTPPSVLRLGLRVEAGLAQAAQGLGDLVALEEGADAGGDLGADLVDVLEFFFRGSHEVVERLVAVREDLGDALADVTDAEGVEEAVQRSLLTAWSRAATRLVRGLLGHAVEVGELLDGEVEEIGDIFDEAVLDELRDQLLAQALDIERHAAAEVLQASFELRKLDAPGGAPDGTDRSINP